MEYKPEIYGSDFAMDSPAVREPLLQRLQRTREVVMKVAAHASSISDRLCGPVPTNKVGDGSKSAGPGGFFEAIEDIAREIERAASNINQDMDRISTRLD